jgi:hypothetical protein
MNFVIHSRYIHKAELMMIPAKASFPLPMAVSLLSPLGLVGFVEVNGAELFELTLDNLVVFVLREVVRPAMLTFVEIFELSVSTGFGT